MPKNGNIEISLYSRMGFKNHVGKECKKNLEQYIEENHVLDVRDFSQRFDVHKVAQKLYREVGDIEKYNEELVSKPLFLEEIAYVVDRHMPYHIYRKFEELHGRIPKPLKNFSHRIFPKDKFKDSSALYEYQINQEQLLQKLGVKKEPDSEGKAKTVIQRKPGRKREKRGKKAEETKKREIATPDAEHERNGNFIAIKNKYSDDEILAFMDELGFSKENFAVMANDVEYIERTNAKLLSEDFNRHMRDKRPPMVFQRNVVTGWIFESLLMKRINDANCGITIELNGSDSDRVLAGRSPTCKADYIARYMGMEVPVENVMSHTGYFYMENLIGLRDNKRRRIREQKSILLGIETFYNFNSGKYRARERELPNPLDAVYALLTYRELGMVQKGYSNGMNKQAESVCVERNRWNYFNQFLEELKFKIIESCG